VSEFRFAEPQFVHWLWGVLAAVGLLLWSTSAEAVRSIACSLPCCKQDWFAVQASGDGARASCCWDSRRCVSWPR